MPSWKEKTRNKRDGEQTVTKTREIRGTAKIFKSGVHKVKLIRVWTLIQDAAKVFLKSVKREFK